MKINIYELLGMVKDEPDRSIYVKYFDRVNKKEDVMWACKENIIYKLDQLIIDLNDEVEILEEEKKIPENNFNYIYSCEDEHIMVNFENIKTTLKDIIDYLKSKGDE